MSGGLIIPDKQTAKALNDLARHKTILRLLQDIRIDMEICEIEGWDKTEYLIQIKQLINSMGGTAEMTELKPCPFCGNKVDYNYDASLEPIGVFCVRCKAVIRFTRIKPMGKRTAGDVMAEIAEHWNRRIENPRTVTAE